MKKEKLSGLVFCLMAVVFLFAGCATFEDKPKKADKADKANEVYVAPTGGLENCKSPEDAGKKMIDSIYMGISTGNYALYSRDFTDKNKKYFDKKIFKQAHEAVKEKLGEYQGIKFVGFWKKGDYDILLWKSRFSQTKDDVLVQMYVTKDNGIYKIAALKLI